MHRNSQPQNKPKREAAHSRELASLKKENHNLKRGLKRLAKEISKRTSVEEDTAEAGLEETIVTEAPAEECFSCQVEMRMVTLNNKTYAICPDCKARKRVE